MRMLRPKEAIGSKSWNLGLGKNKIKATLIKGSKLGTVSIIAVGTQYKMSYEAWLG